MQDEQFILRHTVDRCLARTSKGFIALVPASAQISDQLYLLYGGQVVYCLRKTTDSFKFIGECYVHGVMDGEAVEVFYLSKSDARLEEITLI